MDEPYFQLNIFKKQEEQIIAQNRVTAGTKSLTDKLLRIKKTLGMKKGLISQTVRNTQKLTMEETG
jgi:hypothetical protein